MGVNLTMADGLADGIAYGMVSPSNLDPDQLIIDPFSGLIVALRKPFDGFDKLGSELFKATFDFYYDQPIPPGTQPDPANHETLRDITLSDLNGNTLATLAGLSVDYPTTIAKLESNDSELRYATWTSFFDGAATITGSAGNDRDITVGSGGLATVNTFAGDDHVWAWHAKDIVFDGGTGSDTLTFDAEIGATPPAPNGAVVDLTTGTGTNPFGGTLTLTSVENVGGTEHNDDLRGNASDNLLDGGLGGNDHLRGEGGNDQLVIGTNIAGLPRTVTVDGGTGVDTLFYALDSATGLQQLDILDPAANTGLFAGSTFTGLETFLFLGFLFPGASIVFKGGTVAETVTGRETADTLIGRGGNDTLNGGDGSDHVQGDDGNDVLNGGRGTDTMNGGAGNDTYFLDVSQDRIADTSGIDTIHTQFSVNLSSSALAAIENAIIDFASGNATLTGNARNNVLTIAAFTNAKLAGLGGNDRLTGGIGDESLDGGAGKDILQGGIGRDTLIGGAGADLFLIAATGAANRDVIRDFSHAEHDRINLASIDARSNAGGANDAFTWIGSQAFHHKAGELRFVFSGAARTIIEGDTNGDGHADLQIELTGHHKLVSGDLIL